MDTVPPLPKPRVSHLKQQHPGSKMQKNACKKPVPLPRLKFNEPHCRPTQINSEDSTVIERQTCSMTNHVGGNSDRVLCSERIRSRNLKEEWKIECDDANMKGRSVRERTKNVSASIEKSVRNMLGKRSTVRATGPNKVNDFLEMKICRSQSLPSSDIFQSISFHSPLNVENFPQELVKCEDAVEEECVSTSGAPPPVYPPPPLPDESMYDEVQSVVSSHSSSYEPYCDSNTVDFATHYEDILQVRDNRGHKVSDVSQKATRDVLEGSQSSISRHKFSLRSDSWSYYDNAPEDIYQNMAPSDTSSVTDSDSLIYNRHCNSSLTAESTSSLQLDANCDNNDEVSEGEMCTRSSRQFGQQQSLIIQNDLYENWHTNTRVTRAEGRCNVVTKSVILEFDPLYENADGSSQASHNYSEVLLPADTSRSPYGKINRVDRCNVFENKTENSLEFVCPPVPPRRYDSITVAPSEEGSVTTVLESASEIESVPLPESSINPEGLTVEGAESATSENNSDPIVDSVLGRNRKAALVRWASMKRALQMMAEGSTFMKMVKEQVGAENKSGYQNSVFYGGQSEESAVVKRPELVPNAAIQRSGVLYRSAFGSRDFMPRRCELTDGKLLYYSDKSGTSLSETITLDKMLSIQFVPEHKVGVDGEDLHVFELNVACKGSSHLFGVPGPTERRIWMQKILESTTSAFPVRLLTEYIKAGWCFMKEGISGTWMSAWILVQERTLFYCMQDGTLQEADLRKARCTVLQDSKPEATRLSVTEKGPLILVDFPGQALYLQMDVARETVAWHGVIRAAAVDNGLHLAQQQLTREEIPVIIDKCINFIYAHGSMSQGIYRRSGANSSITRLLMLFRQDAWAVQLTRQEYTEYDVSSVLKRFLRDLPEPLLTTELHSQLCEIAAGKRGSDKSVHYRRVLEQLPPINYLTTRKLIGHLHFIHEQHEKNLMPVENLAAIWGPTLMHVEGDNLIWAKLESGVVSDLILLFFKIFEVDAAELSREKRMLEVLERYHSANSSTPQNKTSGDLKIWVYLEHKDSSNCVNVTVGPQKLAGEMCLELASKTSLPAHELCLEEVVCGGALTRPLHHTERVLDVVLRWGYWSDVDRKDNCLVLCPNTVLKEAAGQAKYPLPLCRDLRFADRKSRSFKMYLFEFSQAKLCYYKDRSGSVKVGEWKIEDIVWYLGYEPKRNPQMRWAITFIDKHEKPERSRENPHFGYTFAGTSKEDQVRWIGAMLAAEHPQNVLPSPVLLQ